jgi:hypothetical protein
LVANTDNHISRALDQYRKTTNEGIQCLLAIYQLVSRCAHLLRILGSFGAFGDMKFSFFVHCSDLSITALKNTLGLFNDQYGEILDYLCSSKPSAVGLAAVCKSLKKERLWHMVYNHPQNPHVHESRSMLLLHSHTLLPNTVALSACTFSIPWWVQFLPNIFSENAQELVRVTKIVKNTSAIKVNFGKWIPTAEDPWPAWETVAKAPIWASEEWASFRAALSRPLAQPTVTFSGTDMSVITRNARDDPTDETKARYFVSQLSRNSAPVEFNKPYALVCGARLRHFTLLGPLAAMVRNVCCH